MHTTAKRCLIWAGVLAAAGAFVFAISTVLMDWLQALFSPNLDIAFHVFSFFIHVVGSFALPLAAALVGAAIVIQTLAPREPAPAPRVSRPVD